MKDNDKLLKIFGKKVRNERLKQGVTQVQLAQKAGLDRTYIWHIENGTRNPSLQSMYKVARGLKVKLTDLIAGF